MSGDHGNPVLTIERHASRSAQPATLLTLNRPDKRNCLSERLMVELTAAVNQNGDRTLFITGSGPAFCSGLDLTYLRGAIEQDGSAAAPLRLLRELYEALRTHPLPTLALVNGPAVGGGVGLAAACDLVVAVRSATFTLPGGAYALLAGVVVPLLKSRTGSDGPGDTGWLGTTVTSTDAKTLGLVDRIVDHGPDLTPETACRTLAEAGLLDRQPTVPRGAASLTAELDEAFQAATRP